MTNRFLTQAADYMGKPARIAHHHDECGETHVIIEMKFKGGVHYLDWIGGDYAPEPDEFGDQVPYENLVWEKV